MGTLFRLIGWILMGAALAMLAIDGILRSPADVDALTAFAIARLQSGIAVLPSS